MNRWEGTGFIYDFPVVTPGQGKGTGEKPHAEVRFTMLVADESGEGVAEQIPIVARFDQDVDLHLGQKIAVAGTLRVHQPSMPISSGHEGSRLQLSAFWVQATSITPATVKQVMEG